MPSLREAAVRATLGLRRHPVAFEALGDLLGALPPECGHFALRGLARLADDTPSEALSAAIAALESAPGLSPPRSQGTARRVKAAEDLEAAARDRFTRIYEPETLGRAVFASCYDDPDVWVDRICRVFDVQELDAEQYLRMVAAFAPSIARLGGPATVKALAARLQGPRPVPDFARPWTHAAGGSFDA